MKLFKSNWWPSCFFAWLMHGVPCDVPNNQFIKINHGREPALGNGKTLLTSVKKKTSELKTEVKHEGRAMKRAKARQINEGNVVDLTNNNNTTTKLITHNHVITKQLTLQEMRAHLVQIYDDIIATYDRLETCTDENQFFFINKKLTILKESHESMEVQIKNCEKENISNTKAIINNINVSTPLGSQPISDLTQTNSQNNFLI